MSTQLIASPSVILPSQPLDSVRNLGSWFESNMCMSIHIDKICSKAFHGLYKIRQIRKFLSPESTKTLVQAFVTSHLDYCNSLPFGVPKYQTDRLYKVLNAAARLIFRIPKFDHISSALSHLHWLPVTYRVHFKLLLLVYKSLNNQGPQYIQEYLQPHSTSGHHLRSCDQGLLRSQELILRPLVIALLFHFGGINCRLKFKIVRV